MYVFRKISFFLCVYLLKTSGLLPIFLAILLAKFYHILKVRLHPGPARLRQRVPFERRPPRGLALLPREAGGQRRRRGRRVLVLLRGGRLLAGGEDGGGARQGERRGGKARLVRAKRKVRLRQNKH